MLARLAEELDRERHVDFPPWLFPSPIERGLRDGSVLISSRHLLNLPDPKQIVAAAVPRRALCHVIHAPPFYLVHTPGLFEGTLIRAKAESKSRNDVHLKRARRMKI